VPGPPANRERIRDLRRTRSYFDERFGQPPATPPPPRRPARIASCRVRNGSNLGRRADPAGKTSAPSPKATEAQSRQGAELGANDRDPRGRPLLRPFGFRSHFPSRDTPPEGWDALAVETQRTGPGPRARSPRSAEPKVATISQRASRLWRRRSGGRRSSDRSPEVGWEHREGRLEGQLGSNKTGLNAPARVTSCLAARHAFSGREFRRIAYRGGREARGREVLRLAEGGG